MLKVFTTWASLFLSAAFSFGCMSKCLILISMQFSCMTYPLSPPVLEISIVNWKFTCEILALCNQITLSPEISDLLDLAVYIHSPFFDPKGNLYSSNRCPGFNSVSNGRDICGSDKREILPYFDIWPI